MKELLAKRKAHLIFPSAFLLAVVFEITIGLMTGQTVLDALWNAFSAIKPIDYMMFAAFWYMCAVHRPRDDWDGPLTSLNLFRTER
jgi:hypothetical protein